MANETASAAVRGVHSIREDEAAQLIGFSVSWLRQARMRGIGPPYVKLGRSVRYRVSALEDWLEHHTVAPRAAGDR